MSRLATSRGNRIVWRRPGPGSILMVATIALALFVLVQKTVLLVSAPAERVETGVEKPAAEAGLSDPPLDELSIGGWASIVPAAGENAMSGEDEAVAQAVANPDRGLLEERERTLDLASTQALEDVAADLKQRQAELDRREAEVTRREETLAATRVKLDGQLDRLEALRDEISGMIEKVEADEEARLQQLVAIYEKMKGKDAAKIFDRLDQDVMLKVAVRMREAKLATILAKMDAGRARFLTTELAKQLELPTVGP